MSNIIQILMERDEMSEEEARVVFEDLQIQLDEFLMEGREIEAYYILEQIGIEPDYITELCF